MYLKAHITDRWHPVDRLAHDRLIRCLDEQPDYIFAVFPGVDSYSHLRHPTSEQTLRAYRFADDSIGKVVAKLKVQRRWDDTLLFVTSDHGMTATDSHLDLAIFLHDRGIRTMYYPVIWKRKPEASVMISGNALGMVYFLGSGSTVPLKGSAVKEALGPVWDELLARDEIDFLAWQGDDDSYEIMSAQGSASIIRSDNGLTYRCRYGNPLGLDLPDNSLGPDQSLDATFNTNYPDALVQFEQLFSSPRCGDLIVVSKNGFDLRKAFEWPEHHASHGSLHRAHMIVPLIYNHDGWEDRPARTVDIFNTTLKWLGRPTVEDVDGNALF
jgi:arylsulfatase A-like enzyme